ncbi:MAG: YHYH protein [Actinobacteria bacterium]|nr:YHYH protein [Actinomycetota bacterium]
MPEMPTTRTKAQNYNFTIPTSPKYSSKTSSTSLGSIGVMISGAVLYNPFEGDGKSVAMANNFTITNADGISASFVDKCAGHPTPQQGAYHYHGLPTCVTAQVDKVSKPSHIIGFALDGFPIYGDRDIKGKQLTAKNLDQCNGIYSATPEFPKGIYHYVLLSTSDVRSSIACFHGEVDSSQIQAMPKMGGAQMPMPDLAAAAKKLGVTEEVLKAAFGTNMQPDIAAAAKKLGVTEAVLLEALGIKG